MSRHAISGRLSWGLKEFISFTASRLRAGPEDLPEGALALARALRRGGMFGRGVENRKDTARPSLDPRTHKRGPGRHENELFGSGFQKGVQVFPKGFRRGFQGLPKGFQWASKLLGRRQPCANAIIYGT